MDMNTVVFGAQVITIDLLLVFLIFFALRWLIGWVSHVDSMQELAVRDNAAFGISLTGSFIGVALMLTGVLEGDSQNDLLTESLSVLAFGALGIVLMLLARKLFDHLSFPQLSIHDLIMQNNVSAGIVDAGNVIASGLVIRAALIWTEGNWINSIAMVILAYVFSQGVLVLATLWRARVYRKNNPEGELSDALRDNNVALALRFSGFRIAVALMIGATAGLVPYSVGGMFLQTCWWALASVACLPLLVLVSSLTVRGVLSGISLSEEVDQQHNVGVGAVEGSIYVAIGLLLTSLLSA
jgi:uncharacterized membrane protein YjfL (UPF0719 family)